MNVPLLDSQFVSSYQQNTKSCYEDPTTIKRLFLSSLSLPNTRVKISPVSLVLTSGMLSSINKARWGIQKTGQLEFSHGLQVSHNKNTGSMKKNLPDSLPLKRIHFWLEKISWRTLEPHTLNVIIGDYVPFWSKQKKVVDSCTYEGQFFHVINGKFKRKIVSKIISYFSGVCHLSKFIPVPSLK